MRLCFDATRFGCGLLEAVNLAVEKELPGCEFSFDEFDVSHKNSGGLDTAEKDYLKSVADLSRSAQIEIACLKLNTVLKVSEGGSSQEFKAQLDKLSDVAALLNCRRLLFYMQAEADSDFLSRAESLLNPLVAAAAERGQTLVLSLSTARINQGRSLRSWRPLETQEWRDLLAGVPGLGLSFSAADCAWQGIDYLQVLSGIALAIEHVEAQDIQVNRRIIAENGLFGPLWWRYMTVGKGQIDWAQLIEALKLYNVSANLSIHFDDDFASENEQGLFEALDTSISVLAPLVKY